MPAVIVVSLHHEMMHATYNHRSCNDGFYFLNNKNLRCFLNNLMYDMHMRLITHKDVIQLTTSIIIMSSTDVIHTILNEFLVVFFLDRSGSFWIAVNLKVVPQPTQKAQHDF